MNESWNCSPTETLFDATDAVKDAGWAEQNDVTPIVSSMSRESFLITNLFPFLFSFLPVCGAASEFLFRYCEVLRGSDRLDPWASCFFPQFAVAVEAVVAAGSVADFAVAAVGPVFVPDFAVVAADPDSSSDPGLAGFCSAAVAVVAAC